MSQQTFQQGVNSYLLCTDCHIRQGGADNNTGANNELGLTAYGGGTPSTDQCNALIKFDLTGAFVGTETVTSATLQLYITGQRNGGNTKTVGIAALRRAFVEGLGTGIDGQAANTGETDWNHYAHPTLSWTTPGALSTVSDIFTDNSTTTIANGTTGFVSFNVATIVQNWINSSVTNNGFFLHTTSGDNSNGQFTCASRQHATVANRPLLTVNYTAGGVVFTRNVNIQQAVNRSYTF